MRSAADANVNLQVGSSGLVLSLLADFSLLLKTEKGNKDSFWLGQRMASNRLCIGTGRRGWSRGGSQWFPHGFSMGFPVAKSRPRQGEEGEAAEFRVGWMDKFI